MKSILAFLAAFIVAAGASTGAKVMMAKPVHVAKADAGNGPNGLKEASFASTRACSPAGSRSPVVRETTFKWSTPPQLTRPLDEPRRQQRTRRTPRHARRSLFARARRKRWRRRRHSRHRAHS